MAGHLGLDASLSARFYFSQFANKVQRVTKDLKGPSTSSFSKARFLSSSGFVHVADDFHTQPHLSHWLCPFHLLSSGVHSLFHSLYSVNYLESRDISLVFWMNVSLMKLKPPNDRKPTKNREGGEVIFWPTLSPLSNPRGKLSKTPRCSSTSGIIANDTWFHAFFLPASLLLWISWRL